MNDARALVIGEALVDVVVREDGSREEHPGGSPANVALGLARLGRTADLLTWLAPDEHGDRIREHLAASGVHVLTAPVHASRTPVAVAHLDKTGAATYEFDLEWDLPSSWDGDDVDPVVVHTGSIATTLQPGGAPEARHAIDEGTLTAVLERCARIAAITVSRAGANPPTAAEVDA